jgi:hypothetical protein
LGKFHGCFALSFCAGVGVMIDQDRLVTELNKGWVYASDPLVFFRGYDSFSELLRMAESFDPIQLLKHYEQSIAHKTQPNDQVLRFQLLRMARQKGDEVGTEDFYRFADELVSRRCVTNFDERSVSFLAYQGTISRGDEVFAAMRKDMSRPNQELRIRRKLLRVFDRFDDQNKQTFFGSLLGNDGRGTKLFDVISSIHHQVVDNIDHWMDYPQNPNKTEENQKLFGDTLVFRVSRLSYSTHLQTSFANQSPDLRDYLSSHAELTGRKETRFWRLEYFDNGRGIVENLRQFGRFPSTEFTLKDAIEQNLSIRGDVGPERRKGEGYSIVIDEARNVAGYVSIHSGGERVFISPKTNSQLASEPTTEFKFGTHLSLIFPG